MTTFGTKMEARLSFQACTSSGERRESAQYFRVSGSGSSYVFIHMLLRLCKMDTLKSSG